MVSNTPPGDDRTPFARRADQLGVLIERVAEAYRLLATVAAHRAELVEDARRWSIGTAALAASMAASAATSAAAVVDPQGWNAATVARRELISELACALRIPERTSENLIEDSRTLLTALPDTMNALTAGAISYRHVQTLIGHAGTLPPEAYREFETVVLPFAVKLTVAKFDRKARVLRERLHPDSITARTKISRANRTVTFEPARDGIAYLNAYLPAETAAAAYNRITDIAATLQSPAEGRTLTQLRADVFADILIDGITEEPPETETEITGLSVQDLEVLQALQLDLNETTGSEPTLDPTATTNDIPFTPAPPERQRQGGLGRGIRARVMITVPVLTLLDRTDLKELDEPATLEGYGPIDTETAIRLAATAPSFTRILTHPETGTILSVGRGKHPVPPDLRRWLRIRDETCRFPGCNRSAPRCDIDHTLDWQYDGPTDHNNLAHLCPGHHHLKHHTSWTVSQSQDGNLDWNSPTGHTYSTEPANRMRPVPTFE